MSVNLDEQRVKELLKQALEERKDFFYDLFAEVMEDAALANAIREGEQSESADRAEVFQILDEQA